MHHVSYIEMLDIPCVLWVYLEMPHLMLHTCIPYKKRTLQSLYKWPTICQQ